MTRRNRCLMSTDSSSPPPLPTLPSLRTPGAASLGLRNLSHGPSAAGTRRLVRQRKRTGRHTLDRVDVSALLGCDVAAADIDETEEPRADGSVADSISYSLVRYLDDITAIKEELSECKKSFTPVAIYRNLAGRRLLPRLLLSRVMGGKGQNVEPGHSRWRSVPSKYSIRARSKALVKSQADPQQGNLSRARGGRSLSPDEQRLKKKKTLMRRKLETTERAKQAVSLSPYLMQMKPKYSSHERETRNIGSPRFCPDSTSSLLST